MARITASVYTSHVPAIGAAMDLGKTAEPYWQPLFKGYEFSRRCIKTHTPDVILLDIGLPKLDGYGACRRIREQGGSMVIIALTGWGQEDDKRRSQEAGFNSHMVKPVDLAALTKLLAE